MIMVESERLLLRDWREDDAEALFGIAHDKSVEDAGWKVHETLEESRRCIRCLMEGQECWAVALKATGEVIGSVSLSDINRHNGYQEIEYVISESHRNAGYATEAVRRVLRYAFTELPLLVVAVCHYPFNTASKRVIEKCGFTYEGTLRKYSRNLCDSVRYSMLKEEWEQSNTASSAL